MKGSGDPVLFLQDATVVRPGGETVFRGLNWTIHEGETWAIVGPVGSGKTSLVDVLLGRLHIESGAIGWPLLDRLRAAGRAVSWPSDVIKRVSFREESWLFSYAWHYYQQRFNFIESRDDLTLDAFLRSGTPASDDVIGAAAGITLAAIARSDGFEVFAHSHRIKADVAARGAATQGAVHVA